MMGDPTLQVAPRNVQESPQHDGWVAPTNPFYGVFLQFLIFDFLCVFASCSSRVHVVFPPPFQGSPAGTPAATGSWRSGPRPSLAAWRGRLRPAARRASRWSRTAPTKGLFVRVRSEASWGFSEGRRPAASLFFFFQASSSWWRWIFQTDSATLLPPPQGSIK